MTRLLYAVPALLYVVLLVAGARWEPHLAMLVAPDRMENSTARTAVPVETPIMSACYNEATVFSWDSDGRLTAKCVPIHWIQSSAGAVR